jgi:translocator protein
VLALVGFVGLCLLVGAADVAVVGTAARVWYLSLTAPIGMPPNWLFGFLWTAVHVMMAVAAWLVWRRSTATRPLRLWGWQLAANALWTPAFFTMHSPPLGLAVILILLVLIVVTAQSFRRVQRTAAWLLAPYFSWTGYLGYLTAGFWWLNPT